MMKTILCHCQSKTNLTAKYLYRYCDDNANDDADVAVDVAAPTSAAAEDEEYITNARLLPTGVSYSRCFEP